MIIQYKKIVGLPIFDFRSQQKIGQIKDIVFQAKGFKISGLILGGSFLQFKTKIINSSDIIDMESQGVVVNDGDAVTSLDENIRIKEAVRSGCHGIGQKVVTKSGTSLGRVIDLFISTDTLEISKIHTKGLLSERIIPSAAIVEIRKRKIIVKDNFETIKIGVPAIGPSVI